LKEPQSASVFVSTFWIAVKMGGLGRPVAGVRQRLIQRVGFPKKHVENPRRFERLKLIAHFIIRAIIADTAWLQL
jgi:hypothetical protein